MPVGIIFRNAGTNPTQKLSCDNFKMRNLTSEKTKDPPYHHTTHTPAALLRAYGSISTLSETGGLWGEFVNGSRYYVHYKDDDELRVARALLI
jgi:hypothetical protein